MCLADESASVALGEALSRSLPRQRPALVVALHGDLGAGKSTLARALLRGLGVEGAVRSPTYTLVEPYATAVGHCLHLDLYRLADPSELDYLGLEEQYTDTALWLVEWPERGGDRLPPVDLRIDLARAGAGRLARLQALSLRGEAWLGALRSDASCTAF
ncbi:tRNA (adenosine(37)-N6)-threonylcarbamoyltransferase complex ATPase subunit type 1 TsaE [Lysobacter sp. CAU 1642]|uniref:tRNA threonylcarbamoyladenosine biosynthesis protein TsaE n=1 Tax=Pseudomarimonas salicorniae TaxID=2933270 RepID=A0ABT0GLQ4_9GAMM|nr:tRNA (adenosine(37)-N6)-threonylcarbamoyltransferase complex ATPase subunit type 1 TsaE [Lysobacter sp. CAU 1642]MCK7595435.1 tRNA (adenosine(37)-N6)-threonylcarbamoyltransferase complex ATPase subunit type 1 TsaE [Lysobacter sp. CAU 1642]